MILWLDHKLFGNGYGLKSPHCDSAFYWLDGQLYTFMHGLGCQLQSIQWRTPKPGERRQLAGREFIVFDTSRHGPRVMVSWAMVGLSRLAIDEMNAEIRRLRNDLCQL